jgi:hypothetical protein
MSWASTGRAGCALLLSVALQAPLGCGRTAGGETGSETHWLSDCTSNADCSLGQCLCGQCTETCQVASDCPAPLDVCLVPPASTASSCEVPVCGSSAPGEIEAALANEQRLDACDSGRPTSAFLASDHRGANRAFGNGQHGFVLTSERDYSELVSVGLDGHVKRSQSNPSALSPSLDGLARLADGSALLSGTVMDFDGAHAWAGKLGVEGSLVWELELEPTSIVQVDLVVLPDGGAVVAAVSQQGQTDASSKAFDVWWTRLSRSGGVVWQKQESFVGSSDGSGWETRSLLALTTDAELRIVVQTSAGARMIMGSLDGAYELRSVDTGLAAIQQVVSLPDGRIAIGGDGRVAVLNLDGAVLWERSYGAYFHALAFNAARQELVMVGESSKQGSWILAADLDGEATWELTRAQELAGEDATQLVRGRFPLLIDVAAAPDGSLIAAAFANFVLSYLLVGAGSCGGAASGG